MDEDYPNGEKYLGFENPSASICYANSAVQVLFHCLPLRQAILDYKPATSGDPNKNSNTRDSENNGGDRGRPNGNAGEKDMLYELHHLFK